MGKEACRDLIHFNTKEDYVIVERFMLYSNTKGYMTVFIRQLKLQDAGTYRIGVGTGKSTDVNLAVVNGEEMFNHVLLLKLILFCPLNMKLRFFFLLVFMIDRFLLFWAKNNKCLSWTKYQHHL